MAALVNGSPSTLYGYERSSTGGDLGGRKKRKHIEAQISDRFQRSGAADFVERTTLFHARSRLLVGVTLQVHQQLVVDAIFAFSRTNTL